MFIWWSGYSWLFNWALCNSSWSWENSRKQKIYSVHGEQSLSWTILYLDNPLLGQSFTWTILYCDNPLLRQSFTWTILYLDNPLLGQSFTWAILYLDNPLLGQSFTWTILHLEDPSLGQSFTWTILYLDNPLLGQSFTWIILYLDNPLLGQSFTWTILYLDNPSLGQFFTWTILYLDNPLLGQSFTWTILHLDNPLLGQSCTWTILYLDNPSLGQSFTWTILNFRIFWKKCCVQGRDVFGFWNIPYGEDTSGENRFQPPLPKPALNDGKVEPKNKKCLKIELQNLTLCGEEKIKLQRRQYGICWISFFKLMFFFVQTCLVIRHSIFRFSYLKSFTASLKYYSLFKDTEQERCN